MQQFENARKLIARFKGSSYVHGIGVLGQAGSVAAGLGRKAALVRDAFPGSEVYEKTIRDSLTAARIDLAGVVEGAAPNAPREDVARIATGLKELGPR